jgi:Ni/Fe-hydrogenase subunit HybB-like protein
MTGNGSVMASRQAASHAHEPVGGRLVTGWFIFLLLVIFVAAVVLTQRFVFGLGAATNLSDGYPWGIWIAIDLIIGTALGCGGFVMAFLVYIVNRGEYHPLVRAGLMTSLFGYSLGGLAVMIDLGRYWQGYNILLPWLFNVNSVLLETALCIFAYTLVLMVEFAPAVFERFGMRESRRKLQRVLFVFTALGVLLPMMHQSSMGTVVVLLGYKLSPLWQSQLLTFFFLVTAVTMGFAVVAFESIIAAVAFRRPYEMDVLARLSGVVVWVMVAFLALRVIDLFRLEAWPLAFRMGPQAISFWLEMAAGIASVIILLPRRHRWSPQKVFLGATAILLSGILYRLNCYLVGYDPGQGWRYFPSMGEVLVTLGIVALHLVLYLVFVKNLPVLPAPRRA